MPYVRRISAIGQMNMEIKTKYNIGDKVFVAEKHSIPVKRTCPCCDGERHVFIKAQSYPCPRCNGRGFLATEFLDDWSVAECTVEAVSFTAIRDEVNVLYNFKERSYKRVYEELVFATRPEAEQACRNGSLLRVVC